MAQVVIANPGMLTAVCMNPVGVIGGLAATALATVVFSKACVETQEQLKSWDCKNASWFNPICNTLHAAEVTSCLATAAAGIATYALGTNPGLLV